MTLLFATFQSVLTSVWRVFLAFVILMVMVLIHEAGHYTAGKLLKFKINEFSVGMGPKILSKTKKNGEVVSLRAFPLGGFCAFEGEDAEKSAPDAFNNQKPWKRLIVLFSGAFFNFLSALLICVILFGAYGETVAVVSSVYDYAPTINQQLQEGDIIYKINGKNVFVLDNLSRYMSDEMDVTVLKPNGESVTYRGIQRKTFCTVTVSAMTENLSDGDKVLTNGNSIIRIDGKTISQKGDLQEFLGQAGTICTLTVDGVEPYEFQVERAKLLQTVTFVESEYKGIGMAVTYATHKFAFGTALCRVFPFCGEVGMLVLRTVGGLITGVVGLDQVGGPISTISMTSQVVSYGLPSVLMLIVLISVNLAVFNLLPVPALDGCRMLFVIIEWITKRPVNRKVEAAINTVGLILLFGFVILVDLLKL